MAAVCAISVLVMIAALLAPGKTVPAEFTPPPFEPNAVIGIPNVPDDLGWTELDAQAFLFSVCGKVVVRDAKADIWLTNPQSNSIWLKVRILDEDGNILGQSGLLRPGEYVQTVTFDEMPADGTAIGLKIMAYQPETYYSEGSATLNTTVKVEE